MGRPIVYPMVYTMVYSADRLMYGASCGAFNGEIHSLTLAIWYAVV